MNPYISRLVSIFGIRWNMYHVMSVMLRNFIATKFPFFTKMRVKMTICTSHVRGTPKTHMKPDISRLVSIYGIRWNIYHIAAGKANKIYWQVITFLCPKWVSI